MEFQRLLCYQNAIIDVDTLGPDLRRVLYRHCARRDVHGPQWGRTPSHLIFRVVHESHALRRFALWIAHTRTDKHGRTHIHKTRNRI